jgi:hypothetical protein
MRKLLFILPLGLFFIPEIALGYYVSTPLGNIIRVNIYGIVNQLITLLVSLAIALFFYGIIKSMLSAGDPKARKEGINIMIYGIVALFVMVSLWGLVAILQNTFGVSGFGGQAQIFPAPHT